MSNNASALRLYLAVSFLITWICWIPVTMATYGLASFANPYPENWFNDLLAGGPFTLSHLLLLAGGVLGPAIGALVAWKKLAGAEGVRTLLTHLYKVKISDGKGWLTSLIPAVMFGLAALIVFSLSGAVIGITAPAGLFVAGIVFGGLMILGEEMGWRGTQLPLLQETRGALWSSTLVGLTWAVWHLPLLLMFAAPEEGTDASALGNFLGIAIPYVLMSIPLAIAHTFAFNSARGLLLVVIIAHSLSNAFNADMGPIAGSEEQIASAGAMAGPILLLSFWVVAIALWLIFKRENLSWRSKVTAQTMLDQAKTS